MAIPMDSLSICRIIRESARSRVSELKIGDLQISFQLGSESKLEPLTPLASQPEINISQQELAPRVQLTEDQKDSFKSFQEAQVLIEDPLAYEESIIDEHLEGYRVRGNGRTGDEDAFARGSE